MKRMFWIDLEMTGLDERKDHILEVAVMITDLDCNELDTYHRIVYQPTEVLENMNDWCKKQHGTSGLTALVPTGEPLSQVEQELIALAAKHYPNDKEKIVLCGNSVGNDQRFVFQYLPQFSKRLHYRVLDVTSFKEWFRSKYHVKVEKQKGHRAVDDIRESIKEFQTYLKFIHPPESKPASK